MRKITAKRKNKDSSPTSQREQDTTYHRDCLLGSWPEQSLLICYVLGSLHHLVLSTGQALCLVMTNQMASRFRVKKLSPKHPLPVFKEKQLPDLDEANLQRAVPQIETGVEKDEEEEVKYHSWCVV